MKRIILLATIAAILTVMLVAGTALAAPGKGKGGGDGGGKGQTISKGSGYTNSPKYIPEPV